MNWNTNRKSTTSYEIKKNRKFKPYWHLLTQQFSSFVNQILNSVKPIIIIVFNIELIFSVRNIKIHSSQ